MTNAEMGGLIEAVWRAAIDKVMEQAGWKGDTHTGYDREDGPAYSYEGHLPPVSGPTGTVTITTTFTDPEHRLPSSKREDTVDAWNDYYRPWKERIENLFEGWDQLPEPDDFDKLINPLKDVVSDLSCSTGSTQQGGSTTGNPDLIGIFSSIRRGLTLHTDDEQSSTALMTFNQYYGPDKVETIIGNLRQGVIVLGLAQQGGKQLWAKAQADIAKLARDAARAFKSADPPKQHPFEVLGAFVGLVGAFVPEAAAVAGAVGATLSFVDAVKPPERLKKVDDPTLAGTSPEEVFNNLATSIRNLNTACTQGEDDLHKSLKDMLASMNHKPRYFSLCVQKGVEKDVKKMGTINVDTQQMKVVGFRYMPEVAAVLGSSVPKLETADSSLPWMRPWNIGYGSSGPWDEYFYLNEMVSGAISSNVNQIVLAGDALAAAAGYLDDADGMSRDSLTKIHKDVSDSSTGFKHVDDSPPQYTQLPNGKRIPV